MGNTDSPAFQGILFSGGHSKWLIHHPRLTYTVKMASLLPLVEETKVPHSSGAFEKLVEKKKRLLLNYSRGAPQALL